MNFETKLNQYAQLVLSKGINLQPKQQLVIMAPIDSKEFVKALYKNAYEMDSGLVHVFWSYEDLSPIFYEHASDECINAFPQWRKDAFIKLADEGAAFLSISASNPNLLKDSDPTKIAASTKSSQMGMMDFNVRLVSGELRWNVVSVPTVAWATEVFKDLDANAAVDKLWDYIFEVTRVNTGDAISAWDTHVENLQSKSSYLNNAQFDSLHYYSERTDLHVELVKNHIWVAGPKTANDGVDFIPNIPTEEVFTMNKKDGVNGTLYSTMPLNYSGQLITDMEFTFKDGKVVDYKASSGLELLKTLLETDEGASYLGEVALVPYTSPISNLKTIFFNTLYDENASCHFAFGRAYPYTIEKGTQMSAEELSSAGANYSLTHVDFMVGSNTLNIDGIKDNGEIVPIFRNGEWVI